MIGLSSDMEIINRIFQSYDMSCSIVFDRKTNNGRGFFLRKNCEECGGNELDDQSFERSLFLTEKD